MSATVTPAVTATVTPARGRLRTVAELALWLLLSGATYALVLRFVFPGYFDPAWPHHTDFYMPGRYRAGLIDAIAQAGSVRPVGYIATALLGNLGLRGSIVAIIVVANLNAALSLLWFRRATGTALSAGFVVGAAVYLYLLYSSPAFYVIYTHDTWAQTSFLFLAAGAGWWWTLRERHLPLAVAGLLCLAMLAFLSKETYGPTAILVATATALLGPGQSGERSAVRRFAPVATVATALLLALAFGMARQSPFLGQQAVEAYRVDVSLTSLARETWRYASDGVNLLSLAALLLAVACAWAVRGRRVALVALSAIVAGAIAWLPNAALPNHFNLGYAWNGAYLLFLPCALLPGALLPGAFLRRAARGAALAAAWAKRRLVWQAASVAGIAAALASPALVGAQPAAVGHWLVGMEATQRNIWQALQPLIAGLPHDRPTRILVTGLTSPYGPFRRPPAPPELVGDRPVTFDVVHYPPFPSGSDANVTAIEPPAIDPVLYDEAWMFAPDGTLIRTLDRAALARLAAEAAPAGPALALAFPRLFDALPALAAATARPACAIAEIVASYDEPDLARPWVERCAVP